MPLSPLDLFPRALALMLLLGSGASAQPSASAPPSASTTATSRATAPAPPPASAPAPAPALALPNPTCPVMPWQEASPEHRLVVGGKPVYFCCSDCVAEFRAHPEDYLEAVPQLAGADLAALEAEVRGRAEGGGHVHGPGYHAFMAAGGHGLPWWVWAAACLALLLVVRVARRAAREERPEGGPHPALLKLVITVQLAILLPLALVYHRTREELTRLKVEDMLHHATFKDFGDPPRPLHPPFPPRLKATYWRGNDERNPRLFNGGNYLTATFRTSLRAGPESPELEAGAQVGGRSLALRLEVRRAPNTPDFFYRPEILDTIFLSREAGHFVGSPEHPVPDRVELRVLEPLQRFEARYPLGQVPAEGPWRTQGVVYVYQLVTPPGGGEPLGARYHYGIEYDLRARDGVLLADSDMWMGFLYRTRKSGVNKIPHRQWFSWEPLPPIPDGLATEDAALLGIEDYEATPEG